MENRRVTDTHDTESILARHDVEIQAIDSKLDSLTGQVSAGFERIYSQLRDQSKFPTTTVMTAIFGLISVIALLAGGYIGKPMTEIKHRQDWMLNQYIEDQKTLSYTLGKREHMIDTNAESIEHLDTVLQREMRLLDDISNERLKSLDEVLQREMRLLGDVLKEKIHAIDEKVSITTESRFTSKEGDRLEKQINEISEEQRRRTNKVYK